MLQDIELLQSNKNSLTSSKPVTLFKDVFQLKPQSMKSGRNYNYCFMCDVYDTKINKLKWCNVSRSLVSNNVLGKETWLIFNNNHKDRKGVILFFFKTHIFSKKKFPIYCTSRDIPKVIYGFITHVIFF